jgi:hypothetical protein
MLNCIGRVPLRCDSRGAANLWMPAPWLPVRAEVLITEARISRYQWCSGDALRRFNLNRHSVGCQRDEELASQLVTALRKGGYRRAFKARLARREDKGIRIVELRTVGRGTAAWLVDQRC